MADWIESFVKATSKLPSPEEFRLWSAITAVSGVMERKVWTQGSGGHIYPNLFTVLVGAPASGKTQAIKQIREVWSNMPEVRIAPDNVTKASLIDALGRAFRTVIINGGAGAMNFSSMSVPCSEFGVFFTNHDLEFLSAMNNIYDSPVVYREERRTLGIIEVNKPHLILLAGTQPDFLGTFLPEEAWGMGFASRLILIYSGAAPTTDLFASRDIDIKELSRGIAPVFDLVGEFKWTEAARKEINAWNKAGAPPVPNHTRLKHYCGRRALHVMKLSMISAASRTKSLIVETEDFERARDWLLHAEERMPDVFKAMAQKSDIQVIRDMHYEIYRKWSIVPQDKRKAVHDNELVKFLSSRVPSHSIQRIIEIAERAGFFKRAPYPDEWLPQPMNTIDTGGEI